MKRATKDVLYFETGPDNEPTLHVEPGRGVRGRGRSSTAAPGLTTTRTATSWTGSCAPATLLAGASTSRAPSPARCWSSTWAR